MAAAPKGCAHGRDGRALRGYDRAVESSVANEQPLEIFGKDDCPYTRAALRDYRAKGREVAYFDVTRDPAAMKRYLELSLGERGVPLIVDRGRISIGYGGA